jgi:hypothetical protein
MDCLVWLGRREESDGPEVPLTPDPTVLERCPDALICRVPLGVADERAVRAEVSSGGEEPGDHRGVARVPDGALPDCCAGHERVATVTQ